MSFEDFIQNLIHQVDLNIYHQGKEPELDIETNKYCFFIFTKYNHESNERWDVPELRGDWKWIGSSWLGNWHENQYSGSNLDDLIHNETIVRNRLNEYVARGVLTDFRIRYRYPTLR